MRQIQGTLFPDVAAPPAIADASSSTFVDNLSLPVHRWFRYSAGFSARWVEDVIDQHRTRGPLRVFDPFAGSATTLLASESRCVDSCGVESHPFVCRVARAKLAWRTDPTAYRTRIRDIIARSRCLPVGSQAYPDLIRKCYDEQTLAKLDVLRQAIVESDDGSPSAQLAWLTLVAVLRKTSHAGTAQWQYILPRKRKRSVPDADFAFEQCAEMVFRDMRIGEAIVGPRATFVEGDARTCAAIPDGYATLVITSPPYPNNYDYADATRLEMSFMGEIQGWGDLQQRVRRHLIRSCSQHVPEKDVDLDEVLEMPEVAPIRDELADVCRELKAIRLTKGGRKTYHLMIACYFYDMAQVWRSLRRVCADGASVCLVIGDSAPYGVYVSVVPWLERLAAAAGFGAARFERTRARNTKWKNRKHRVPLQEGRLWVEG
jgi:hypothetical protein